MAIRAASSMLGLLLIASGPALAASRTTDAEAHAVEERALRAQIDHMDDELQALEVRLYGLEKEHAGDASRRADADALRAQIHRMDRDQELLEDRVHELEKQDPPVAPQRKQAGHAAAPAEEIAKPPPSAPTPPPMPPPPAPTVAPAPTPPPPRSGSNLRQPADPAVYDKAAGSRVGMFRYNSYRWVPVGTRELAVYNTYDEAYLLGFSEDCPALLTTERITIENFSTKVVAGRHAVVADGQRCMISEIHELNLNRLPPLR